LSFESLTQLIEKRVVVLSFETLTQLIEKLVEVVVVVEVADSTIS
jgi:hypothetical protein